MKHYIADQAGVEAGRNMVTPASLCTGNPNLPASVMAVQKDNA